MTGALAVWPAAGLAGILLVGVASPLLAAGPLEQVDPLGPENLSVSMKFLALLTILSVAPAILLLTTAFPRIVIVLGFVRRALSTQEVPPNQVIIGLALILTFFVMAPTLDAVRRDAVVPYMDGEISDRAALDHAVHHMREFMWQHVDRDSMDAMISVSMPEVTADAFERIERAEVPTFTLIPAFLLSELKRAFEMGFMLYLPFVVIDLVVASTLISMGMLVLPPVLISLPFKVLVFVLVDGWEIIVTQLVSSF